MCIQWARVLYSVVLTQQSNPPISQFNSPCNVFTSVWSMFVYNTKQYSLSARAGNFGSLLSLEGRSKKYLSGSGFTGWAISFND